MRLGLSGSFIKFYGFQVEELGFFFSGVGFNLFCFRKKKLKNLDILV